MVLMYDVAMYDVFLSPRDICVLNYYLFGYGEPLVF